MLYTCPIGETQVVAFEAGQLRGVWLGNTAFVLLVLLPRLTDGDPVDVPEVKRGPEEDADIIGVSDCEEVAIDESDCGEEVEPGGDDDIVARKLELNAEDDVVMVLLDGTEEAIPRSPSVKGGGVVPLTQLSTYVRLVESDPAGGENASEVKLNVALAGIVAASTLKMTVPEFSTVKLH